MYIYIYKWLSLISKLACAWLWGYLLDHGILVAILIKKVIPLFQQSVTINTDPQQETGPPNTLPIHPGMMVGSVLHRFYAASHRCCELVNINILVMSIQAHVLNAWSSVLCSHCDCVSESQCVWSDNNFSPSNLNVEALCASGSVLWCGRE